MMETPSKTVIIFRKRMLPYSETFIAAQGTNLPTWKPLFAGATADRSGWPLLKNADTCILTEAVPSWRKRWDSLLFKRLGKVPAPWLKKLAAFRPDLLHVHFGPDALFMGMPLSAALRIPLIVTFHGFDITINDPGSTYQKRRTELFSRASKVIAVSDYIRHQLEAHGCPPEKIIRHYIGIDLEKFIPIPGDFVRKDIVFVGRLTEKKGCCDLIEAMRLIADRFPDQRLHIIGDGALRESLGELARPLGGRVVFHGRQGPDFVREKVGRAAVFCAPSVTSRTGDAEGLGMVNLEAMALGTPVVSTFHTAIPEAVAHNQTGILVPERDPQALAAALSRCISETETSRDLGRKGRRRVESHFDIRKQCVELERIYDETSS